VSVDSTLQDLRSLFREEQYSRMPVYRESLDNIVGVLHTKDLVRWYVSGGSQATLGSLIRTVPSIHESISADRVLRELRERRSHQAVVVDEFGGTSGLLTLEDVLSELLGQVGDEFKGGGPVAERLSEGRVRLPGAMAVDDAAAALNTEWDTDAATVGGMVTAALGHLPITGERVTIDGYEFEVERVANRVLESVIAVPVQPPSHEGHEGHEE
jgi:CBS domain containing-hemolysin-like protein